MIAGFSRQSFRIRRAPVPAHDANPIQMKNNQSGVRMRIFIVLTMLVLAICCQLAMAADCDSYRGKQIDTAKEAVMPISKALAAVKAHNVRGLFALSSNKLLLLRRSVTGGVDNRVGNVRLALRPRDMDSNFNFDIGGQTFSEFSDRALFDAQNTASAIAVDREVCEGARHCDDALPASEEVPFLIKDLLQCNRTGKGVFVFADGLFVTDMQLVTDKVPVGSALFFAKDNSGYRLAGLIILH
jgi:hypothetical protein